MSETSPQEPETSSAGVWLMRSLPSPGRGTTVLQPVLTEDHREEPAQQSLPDESATRKRNWSASLDLIHEATEAIRISEERASELEQELQRTVTQALQQAEALEAQVATAQRRAELAEQRAAEAEEWLERLHEAVAAGFTRKGRDEPAEQVSDPTA